MPEGGDAKLLQVLCRQARRTRSSISFSRNAASYRPRPKARSHAPRSIPNEPLNASHASSPWSDVLSRAAQSPRECKLCRPLLKGPGAAIGREFSHPLLAAVVAEPEAELQSALDRLMTAGLLFRQGAPPHATYLFKHALVQDAAYGSLLREPRRALHARIAETLESQFPEVAETQPELLARHWQRSWPNRKGCGTVG